jgi:hypothetical protein
VNRRACPPQSRRYPAESPISRVRAKEDETGRLSVAMFCMFLIVWLRTTVVVAFIYHVEHVCHAGP